MNRLQIRNKARTLIDEYGEEASWTNEELNHLIDMAYKKVTSFFMALDESHYTKSASFSITANHEFYALPADFVAIKWVNDENKCPILPLKNSADRVDYLDYGQVVRYYFQKNTIGFLDIPTAAKTFPYEYVYVPADLENDESSPDVPHYLGDELIAAETAIKALEMDEEISPILNEEAKELKKQIREIYYRRNRDYSPQPAGDPALDDLDF